MAVTKEILDQYIVMINERNEVVKTINNLECQIEKIQKILESIECGEKVKDKVCGGAGGLQSFVIEGVPTAEYSKKKTDLQRKMLKLNDRQAVLERLEEELENSLNDVEQWLLEIKDSRIRLIVRCKYIQGLSWKEVAKKVGGNNTEEGVKSAFHRFFEKK